MIERVTWLLPVKNGMPYLPETLASIEAQTYKNWEILVWDNGSTDGTIEYLTKWVPSRLPGRVFTDKPTNLGVSRAEMVEKCKTELCALIDADDINLPERLEKQVAFLAAHSDVAVVGSQMYYMDAQGIIDPKKLYTVPIHHDDIVHAMLIRNSIAQPSVIFRRSVVLQVGNYRHLPEWNGVNIEDYDLWLRIATQYKLANLDVPLVRYRIHDQSTTQVAIRENRLINAMNLCISKNAPILFGCTSSEMESLQRKQHPCAIKVIYKIAMHLHQNQGGKLLNRLRSDSFIQSAKCLIYSKDVISRLAIASLDRKLSALHTEIISINKSLFLKLPVLSRKYEQLQQYRQDKKWNKKVRTWLSSKIKEGTFISPTIDFNGGVRPDLEKLEIEPDSFIDKDVSLWISQDEGANPKFVMKNKAYIGRNTYIGVFQPIIIGKDAQIGAYSYIISANHCYERRDIPIREQGFVGAPIVIEDDAWLGTHVVVLPGVTIGKGAIIAASSVVNKDIPPYEVWGGVPAKFIKKRPE